MQIKLVKTLQFKIHPKQIKSLKRHSGPKVFTDLKLTFLLKLMTKNSMTKIMQSF